MSNSIEIIEASVPACCARDRWLASARWAAEIHRTQVRKGTGEPYVQHLLRVSLAVALMTGREDAAIAALLHDAVEDQGIPLELIAERCGQRVAEIVGHATEEGVDGHAEKPPWRQRKRNHILHMASLRDRLAIAVILADKTDNLNAMREAQIRGEDPFAILKDEPVVNLGFYAAAMDALDAAVIALHEENMQDLHLSVLIEWQIDDTRRIIETIRSSAGLAAEDVPSKFLKAVGLQE
jgi:(p)ppGpp synthase/HD superfamily hydrolase